MIKENTKGKKKEVVSNNEPKRIISIDRFRGLCMFIVVAAFFVGVFEDQLAKWSLLFEHGDKGFQVLPGIAFADLFAPMFIFVIGLTMIKSFKSREKKYGTKQAYWQLATRFLGLIGIGALLNGFEDGWIDVFAGDAFSTLNANTQVFAIGFIIGLVALIGLIVTRFIKNDKVKDIAEKISRYYLAVIGIICVYFLIVSTGERVADPAVKKYGGWIWDTLQNIGLAGLLALPFVKFDKWGRLIMVGIAFAVMTVFVQNGGFPLVRGILEGGLFGAISWAGILLLGSIFVEIRGKNSYWILTSIMLLLSVILIVGFDFIAAKRGSTPVYAMFTASVAAMIWGGLDALNNWTPRFKFFTWWGGSALFTYVTNYMVCLILGIVFTLTNPVLPLWAAILIIVLALAIYSVANWLLVKNNKYIRL